MYNWVAIESICPNIIKIFFFNLQKMIKNTTISKAPRSAAARKITKSKKATTTKRLKKSKSRNKRKQTKLFNSASTIYSWNELASLNQNNSNNTHLDYSSATNLDQSNNQQLLEDFNLLVNLVAYGLRSNQLNGLQANSDQFGNFHNYDQSNGMSWNGSGNGNGNCLTIQNVTNISLCSYFKYILNFTFFNSNHRRHRKVGMVNTVVSIAQ